MSKHDDLVDHCYTKSIGVPLETIAELIESEVGPVQRESGGIFFDGTVGTTHIRVTAVDVDTIDREKVANVISIVTELPELPVPAQTKPLPPLIWVQASAPPFGMKRQGVSSW